MIKSFYLIVPFFLFLILTIPTLAYAPVNINKTSAGYIDGWRSGFACTNITGTFYCYLVGNDGAPNYNILVEQYNATLDIVTYCDTGLTDYGGAGVVNGLAVANSTHLVWTQVDGTFRVVSTNMSYCGTNQFGSHSAGAGSLLKGAYYNGLNYWGDPIRSISNSSTQTVLAPGFWSIHDVALAFPNQADNVTLWSVVENSNIFLKWVNGVYTSSKLSLQNYYGAGMYYSSTYPYCFDLFNEWIYWVGGDGRLYRANFTDIPGSTSLDFYAIQPINNDTTSDNPILEIYINSSINGTLNWYLDGVLVNTEDFTGTNSSQNIFFTPASSLAIGQHNWSSIYNITPSASWNTGTQYFYVGSVTFWSNPALATSLALAGLFGENDPTAAKDLFSLILSLVVAVIVTVLTTSKIKKADGITNLAVFFGTFIVMTIIFYTVGFMSAWIPFALFMFLIGIAILVLTRGG